MPTKNILAKLKAEDNYRTLSTLTHQGKFVYKDKKKLLNLASNDYLNLAKNEGLKQAFFESLRAEDFYLSSSSSRSLSGNFSIYEEFESSLAKHFKNKEILHFNSGYHLNFSCIAALGTLKNTLFIADKFIHASIIDGLRGAKFLRFRHNDLTHLESLLEAHHNNYEHIIVMSEALFSMDGDFAPLMELVRLKKAYKNILLYIDEAHSVGCFDTSGLGLVKSSGLEGEIDFLVFTFGKAIASVGACMITSKDFKAFFINKARGFIYSTALPPLNVAWSHFVFSNLANFQAQREHLYDLSNYFRQNLQKKGCEMLGQSYIVPLLCGSNEKVGEISSILLKNGIFAPAIKTPSVPKNAARIRFSLHAGLEIEDLEKVLDIL